MQDIIAQALLAFHIVCGIAALAAAALAIAAEKGRVWHINAGKTYFWSMAGVFITAIPLAVLANSLFLFLIALLAFYLAFSGRRFAQNRSGAAQTVDWAAVSLILAAGSGMWLLGIQYFMAGDSQYIVLAVFGFIALAIGYTDFANFRSGSVKGKKRIARHLSNMLAGTIAVTTAVLVTNIKLEPEWILWVAPTVIMTPVIFWWNVRILR